MSNLIIGLSLAFILLAGVGGIILLAKSLEKGLNKK